VNDVSKNEEIPDYISAAGIQSLACQQVLRTDVVTPYATFPSMLINQAVGLIWYHHMLNGPKMQGPFGSTEAVNLNGTLISPLLTWDSKVTTVLAVLGGISNLTSEALQQQYIVQYRRFMMIVKREYSMAFPTLDGTDIELALPTVSIPTNIMGYFTGCSNVTGSKY